MGRHVVKYISLNFACRGFLMLLVYSLWANGQTYDDTSNLFNDLLVSSSYNTEVRPLLNQSKTMMVDVGFQLISIVEVNDVAQSFICNGFIFFSWTDEKLMWNMSKYGGQNLIHPVPGMIWRPRVILMNTLGDRDLFGDNKAPIIITNFGMVRWMPGGLFPTSCDLQMTNYPFDRQTCKIKMVAMSLSVNEMQFIATATEVGQLFYTLNGEWELTQGYIAIGRTMTGPIGLSSVEVTFELKRRPFFFLINILLPVVFLSFLNILVFIIPVDSGEKIGYGITVLLALSVFLSIVSSMIPRSSLTLPKVTVYVFLLLIISMLTVIDSIIIVYLQHKEEEEEKHQKAQENFRSAFTKIRSLQRAVHPMEPASFRDYQKGKKVSASVPALDQLSDEIYLPFSLPVSKTGSKTDVKGETHKSRRVNNYRLIGKYIDKCSFVFFLIVWLAVTLAFLLSMSQD
ncbi:acetylcholine receptor subunit delta-like isoform X1 [Biomphalaria pfeifferi]|uniref:Acetylcholine receptor subunit delta-like isoform X1 n=1 Tax=Biomphalaria pfeifferi TaxID=112525 RepID=A0AAD8BX28_BIOPF|nr:acetylcholine receptor subunit delta-like isoform X1 [Biomphalaria pfeifferi]